MKRLLLSLLLLCMQGAQADAVSDAYSAGSSYGKANSSQGTSGMKSTSPSDVIPGYTANPSQSGYYGGVQGGDGGISDKGQTELGQNAAGQAIISAGTTNPAVTIDPSAPFITAGKDAESTSDAVVSGTYDQCTDTTVSKSTFQNYTCDRDTNYTGTCIRIATAGGHFVTQSTLQTITVDPTSWVYTVANGGVLAQFSLPGGATLVSATLSLHSKNAPTYLSHMQLWGNDIATKNENGDYTQSFSINAAGVVIPDSGIVTAPITAKSGLNIVLDYFQGGFLAWNLTVQIQATQQVWVPEITWAAPNCNVDPATSQLTSTTCTLAGGNRTTIINGQTQTIYSDCWQYTDTYQVNAATNGTCSSLMSNASCTASSTSCTETTNGVCSHVSQTYQCQQVYTSTGKLCGGNYLCMSGDCNDTTGAGDSGFDTAVAKLAGLASAGADVTNDQINIKAFTGQAMSCRKAMAGFSNCCVDSGWGNSAGLANCNSDEMAIGKAKAKKVVVSVGEACNTAVLGVCIQKKQVYCVFGGKLARIIQEQGRRDQLGVSFGSGDSPNCRGITVPELQDINFDLINFADFYTDLMTNQKIPDSSVMVQQVKDRIAAQVNAQTGGK
ncbi:conjugal transfer protein TraN [Rahnella sp. AA]|uniref:type-F conjugative transfer system mating-pair stabilization protein TraN n=1 Tax=Rahnella sp. AA TaxID=2057180 RepID=UPI000C34F123|nr:type-F conjugative transfer system mating-pair stabilization protein TraN [Rahnella sp. AA]PKE27602.1 conjugal transfer protein TraN [Rahnella sp. AA]